MKLYLLKQEEKVMGHILPKGFNWGYYDTSTIKKDITAIMGVTFAVK